VLRLQPKLAVGRVDDPLEREADRVADAVIRTPGPPASFAAAPPRLSRKCAACNEEEDTLLTKPAEPAHRPARQDGAPSIIDDVLRAGGQPLETATRAFFEPRFGRDLSPVRVHIDADAAASARLLGAQAYTVGSDVVFAAGHYAPGTRAGRHLLAHELAHVMQQSGGVEAPLAVQRQADDDATAMDTGPAAAAGDAPQSCAGWESDPQSFSIRAAQTYARDNQGFDRALGTPDTVTCTGTKCVVHWNGPDKWREVSVDLSGLPGRVSAVGTFDPGIIGLRCTYTYSCTVSGSINFTRIGDCDLP
jgi:hypothetical protein